MIQQDSYFDGVIREGDLIVTKKLGKKVSRLVCTAGFGLALLGSSIPQAYAAEATALAGPQISPWALSVLNEGEKYGIYPISWYYDGTFQKPISSDKLKSLLDATDAKLDLLGYTQKPLPAYESEQAITRQSVIHSVYQLLSSYELPQVFNLNTNNPVDYMTKAKLVQGTNLGLELDKPITVEQAAIIASRMIEYAYDRTDKGAKGLMWKVTNGDNTLYLLGSLHLGIPEMYPIEKDVRDAFEASEELWVEANIIAPSSAEINNMLVYTDGTGLKDHVSKETYDKLQQVLTKLGMPSNTFDQYKPSIVSSNLSTVGFFKSQEEQTYAVNAGIDMYFLTKSLLAQKPIHELEGLAFQYNLLYNAPDEKQEKDLADVLDAILSGKDLSEGVKLVREKQMDWVEGDLQGYNATTTAVQQADDSGLTDILLGDRDQNMAKKLAELLEREGKHTSFIVVGSDHYATKGMVVDILKEKGYKVEFVQ